MATGRIKKAFNKLSENIGSDNPKSMKEILKEAGYAQSTAETPQRVTETKGWKELEDKYVPNEMLTQIALSGLTHQRRDNFTGELYNDHDVIFKYWKSWMDRKYPIINKSEVTGKLIMESAVPFPDGESEDTLSTTTKTS